MVLGKMPVDGHVSLRWGSMMGEKRFIRSSYGGARPHRDFPELVELYRSGIYPLGELIEQRIFSLKSMRDLQRCTEEKISAQSLSFDQGTRKFEISRLRNSASSALRSLAAE